MPRSSSYGLISWAVLWLALSFSGSARPPSPDYVEGEALVRFRAFETPATARALAVRHGLSIARHYAWLSEHAGRVIALVRSPALSTAALLAELKADPAVELAEPNYLRWTTDLRTPNDPLFGQLWGLQNTGQFVYSAVGTPGADISFRKGWGLAQFTTNEVVVGVIDTGLDTTHPDLANNLWTNPGEIAGNGVDDDGNGYVDDVHGYDFALHTGSLTDAGSHGTHVCGTIAATGNNAIGVIGVDFQAHIMMLKASSNGASLDAGAIIEAIQYATMMKTNGVNIVALNASYGGGKESTLERAAMEAAGEAGIIFCVAAGNGSSDNDTAPFYPASYSLGNEIVVAASDQHDALAAFSNYGAETVDLAAPGVNILSCLPLTLAGSDASVQQSTNVFSAHALTYSGVTSATGITAIIYDCGLGYPTNFPAGISNNIALIQRSDLYYSNSVGNAIAAGARAAIIFNNTSGNFFGTLLSISNWIPAVSISQADGHALQALLPATGTVVNVPDPAQIYQYLEGTSMAAPHVSGAVAFAAMNFPDDSVWDRVQRIRAGVTPVPALAGVTSTGGRLNLAGIVDSDNNGLPDWWEAQYFDQFTGTDPNADPDGDGANNLAEFLAGTDPTNCLSAFRLSAWRTPGTNVVTLQWPSAPGRYYNLLRSTNLLNGFDTVLQTDIVATPPFNTATDLPPSQAAGSFYRVELAP